MLSDTSFSYLAFNFPTIIPLIILSRRVFYKIRKYFILLLVLSKMTSSCWSLGLFLPVFSFNTKESSKTRWMRVTMSLFDKGLYEITAHVRSHIYVIRLNKSYIPWYTSCSAAIISKDSSQCYKFIGRVI